MDGEGAHKEEKTTRIECFRQDRMWQEAECTIAHMELLHAFKKSYFKRWEKYGIGKREETMGISLIAAEFQLKIQYIKYKQKEGKFVLITRKMLVSNRDRNEHKEPSDLRLYCINVLLKSNVNQPWKPQPKWTSTQYLNEHFKNYNPTLNSREKKGKS